MNQIEIPAHRQIEQNLATINQPADILIRLGRSPEFLQQKDAEGDVAAKFLLESHLIEIAAPTLAEVNAPR